MPSLPRLSVPVLGLVAWLAPAAGGASPPPTVTGFASLSWGSLDAAPSFLDGGFGKLIDGELPGSARTSSFVSEARLGLDWKPAPGWRLFAHGVARVDPASADQTSASGLLEVYGERVWDYGEGHEIGFRLGQFFLPSSRENVDALWTSPYTLTLSAMNSWIAEEVRPIGLDVRYARTSASGHRFSVAGTVFAGNDTSGALLAWRGFAFHARPTPTGWRVPLPEDAARASAFPSQDARGTTPFGDELDSRAGYAGRARWDAPSNRAVVQVTAFRNGGDRDLHGDEYAWKTDFRWLSTQVDLPAGLEAVAEWGSGFSEMGPLPGERSRSAVDVRFDTLYGLLSWRRGGLRVSIRGDIFSVDDLDSTPGDDNREEGSAWTLAVLASFGDAWRAGVEVVDLEANRPAAAADGSARLDSRSALVELRYRF